MSSSDFGAFLRNYRESVGFGLRDFAKRLGISPTVLSAFELGQRRCPPSLNLMKAAELLGIRQGSRDWCKFFDLASDNKIPSDVNEVLTNEEFGSELVALLRTVGRERPSQEVLIELNAHLDKILRAKTP